MPGILLDTHALYWLARNEGSLTQDALIAIARNQEAGTLFVSPVSAWELSIAVQKRSIAGRPDLGSDLPDQWFRAAVRATGARIVTIGVRISLEAARVVTDTGHRDPGDCYLIATARVRSIPIVTRDARMLAMAKANADYLTTIKC